MTAKSQLGQVQKKLTGQQAVLAYFADAVRRYDSYESWAEEVMLTKATVPTIRAAELAKEAARGAAKGQSREAAFDAERDAVRDAVYLACLFMDAAGGFPQREPRYGERASLCAREVQLLILQQLLPGGEGETRAAGSTADEGNGASRATDATSTPAAMWALGSLSERAAAVRSQIEDHLAVLYMERSTAAAIQRNYFAGQPVLFRRDARRLEAAIGTAEAIAEEFNDFVRSLPAQDYDASPNPASHGRSDPRDGLCIDLSAVKRTARSQLRAQITFIVNVAKAQALAKLGRDEEGYDLGVRAFRSRYQGQPDTAR